MFKVQLLTRFRLTEGGYRKKFKIYICFSFVNFTLHAYLVLCWNCCATVASCLSLWCFTDGPSYHLSTFCRFSSTWLQLLTPGLLCLLFFRVRIVCLSVFLRRTVAISRDVNKANLTRGQGRGRGQREWGRRRGQRNFSRPRPKCMRPKPRPGTLEI